MFVAASTRCFAKTPFADACQQITDLEFDKVEIWLSDSESDLKPSEIAADPDRFFTQYRESTRLSPVAFSLAERVDPATFSGLAKASKLLRVTQITIPASPLGTPFNTEIDQLKELLLIATREGIRLSIKTEIGHLTEDPHTAVELCQAVRGLGLTLDPSHYIAGPNRGKSYDQVFPHVYHVHLRDTTPDQLQVQIGLGEIDYSRLIHQLQKQGYNRALSIELLPGSELNQHLELRKLRMLLETLL